MNTLHTRLKQAFPFLGTRPVTENDLHEYCEQNSIAVVFSNCVRQGLYVRYAFDNSEHIFLNSNLAGYEMVYVFAHEIAHAILHVGSRRCRQDKRLGFDDRHSRRNHNEAENAVALLMFPLKDAERALLDARTLNDDRLGELIGRRLRYKLDHGE